jgi:transcriptional regulator with XRE-family HTH domain
MSIKMNNDRAWLELMAAMEEYEPVSAGEMYSRMLEKQQEEPLLSDSSLDVLGRLIELARRRKGLTVSGIAEKNNLELNEVLAIEQGCVTEPEPRVLFMLAKALDLPVKGLMELGGLVQNRDDYLGEAAVRFAANCKPTAKLTRSENEALEEFVKVLDQRSSGE